MPSYSHNHFKEVYVGGGAPFFDKWIPMKAMSLGFQRGRWDPPCNYKTFRNYKKYIHAVCFHVFWNVNVLKLCSLLIFYTNHKGKIIHEVVNPVVKKRFYFAGEIFGFLLFFLFFLLICFFFSFFLRHIGPLKTNSSSRVQK